MNKIINFSKRNLKELLREPLLYIFCLAFPLVLLILFQILNQYSAGHTPLFELPSLLPAIIAFSYTFVTLMMSLIISKDRQTSFLKRLYTSPMKPRHFILGYFSVGFLIGIAQTVICIVFCAFLALITKNDFLSFADALLLIISQLPILITSVFLGICFGISFNDKTAPGISSISISLIGMLGGCWMPVETMGKFELFCRCLPFYPSVSLGRAITNATNSFGSVYTFDKITVLGLLPIGIFMLAAIFFSFLIFRIQRTSDK